MYLKKFIFNVLEEIIRKKRNKYCLIAGSGRNLGCYKNRSAAINREKQVNYFKSKNEESNIAGIVGVSGKIGTMKKRKENE